MDLFTVSANDFLRFSSLDQLFCLRLPHVEDILEIIEVDNVGLELLPWESSFIRALSTIRRSFIKNTQQWLLWPCRTFRVSHTIIHCTKNSGFDIQYKLCSLAHSARGENPKSSVVNSKYFPVFIQHYFITIRRHPLKNAV